MQAYLSKLAYHYVKFAPYLFLFCISYLALGGFLFHVIEPQLDVPSSYQKHLEVFFAIISPFSLGSHALLLVGIIDLLLGWLLMPSLLALILNNVQTALLEEILIEKRRWEGFDGAIYSVINKVEGLTDADRESLLNTLIHRKNLIYAGCCWNCGARITRKEQVCKKCGIKLYE